MGGYWRTGEHGLLLKAWADHVEKLVQPEEEAAKRPLRQEVEQ